LCRRGVRAGAYIFGKFFASDSPAADRFDLSLCSPIHTAFTHL
jgi:hypothetical protein